MSGAMATRRAMRRSSLSSRRGGISRSSIKAALRRDCFKLALGQQLRRWRVTDVPTAAELVRLVRHGDGFSVILLGGSTCRRIDLVDVARLAAAAPQTPILAVADCDDPERARTILRAGARGFLPMSLSLKVLVAALERIRGGGTFVPLVLSNPIRGQGGARAAQAARAGTDPAPARRAGPDLGGQVEQADRRCAVGCRKARSKRM